MNVERVADAAELGDDSYMLDPFGIRDISISSKPRLRNSDMNKHPTLNKQFTEICV